MKVLTVREIMTSNVQMLEASASIAEAASVLSAHHIGGAPVLDRGRVVGVLSKSDLVDPLSGRGAHRPSTAIADVMTPVVYAVRPDDPVMLAVRLMVSEGIHRAVVVKGRGEVVGMITPMDVLRALDRGERLHGEDAQERFAQITSRHVDLRTFEDDDE